MNPGKIEFMKRCSKNVLLYFVLVATTLLSSCDKDDPEKENEEELITTVRLNFQKLDGTTPVGNVISYAWIDLDGSGSNPPVVENIILQANSSYQLKLELVNDSKSPAQDITKEIGDEGVDHQFFFQISPSLQMAVTYNDQDGNGKPIGLTNTVVTNSAGAGSLTVILRHEPNKNAAGVADGQVANAGGDTDVQAEFNVSIN